VRRDLLGAAGARSDSRCYTAMNSEYPGVSTFSVAGFPRAGSTRARKGYG